MKESQTYRDLGRIKELETKVICFHKVQVVHDLVKQVLAFGMFLEYKWVDGNLGYDGWDKRLKTTTCLYKLHTYTQSLKNFISRI
jgi:hypothetical protein